MNPTVGRQLHYWPLGHGPESDYGGGQGQISGDAQGWASVYGAQPLAATIVRVNPDGTVNLTVFHADGETEGMTNVRLWEDDGRGERSNRPVDSFAEWPPINKGGGGGTPVGFERQFSGHGVEAGQVRSAAADDKGRVGHEKLGTAFDPGAAGHELQGRDSHPRMDADHKVQPAGTPNVNHPSAPTPVPHVDHPSATVTPPPLVSAPESPTPAPTPTPNMQPFRPTHE